MSLQVIERQSTTQWYELCGHLEASELFPRLLPNSESIKEMDEEIETEPEVVEGRYDGCLQDDCEMEDEIAEFTKSALSEFHDEALAAAKATLTALQAGQTLLQRGFQDEEEVVLEEAAKALCIAIPWDPVEAAQIATEQAASHARNITYAQSDLAHAQTLLDKNTAVIARGKEHNKPHVLAEEERLRPRRIEQVEEARRKLESLMVGTDSVNAAGAA
jgi:hypothetical protein